MTENEMAVFQIAAMDVVYYLVGCQLKFHSVFDIN